MDRGPSDSRAIEDCLADIGRVITESRPKLGWFPPMVRGLLERLRKELEMRKPVSDPVELLEFLHDQIDGATEARGRDTRIGQHIEWVERAVVALDECRMAADIVATPDLHRRISELVGRKAVV